MDKPPPSYEEAFPDRSQTQLLTTDASYSYQSATQHGEVGAQLPLDEIQSVLGSVKRADIIAVPVLTQLRSDPEERSGPGRKKYIIIDQETGREVLDCMDISNTRGDSNLRGISLVRSDNQKGLLNCGYYFTLTSAFSSLELSSANGVPVGVFRRDGIGMAVLCPCLCLWCCCPLASASVRDGRGDKVLKADGYLFPRKLDFSRPGALGGFKVGSVNVGSLMVDQRVNVELNENASSQEKILMLGVAVGLADYELVYRSRGGYGYNSSN